MVNGAFLLRHMQTVAYWVNISQPVNTQYEIVVLCGFKKAPSGKPAYQKTSQYCDVTSF